MKINELIVEHQQIDELSLGGVGNALAKGVGGVANAVGAVGGGAVGAWDRLKKGFAQGRAAVNDQPDPTAPAGGSAPAPADAAAPAGGGGSAPAGGGSAPAGGGSAPAGGGSAPADAAAPAGGGGDIGSIMQAIDKLDPASKKQLAGDLEKSINTPPPAEEKPADAAAGTPAGTPPAGTPPAEEPGYDTATGVANPSMMAKNREAGKKAAPYGFNRDTGQPNPAPGAAAPEAPPAGTPPPSGKLTQAQQDAKKAELLGKRQAGKTTATQTGSGFNQYVQGGGGSTLAGADKQGNPVFKQNVKREDIQFESKFLGMII